MKTTSDLKIRVLLAAAVSAGLGFVSPASAQQHSYFIDLNSKQITDLGENISVKAINNIGQVAGISNTTGVNRAFITGPNGVGMTDLGTLGGLTSEAYGINDRGQVVGYSAMVTGDRHAFITGPNGAGMTDLGTLGGTESFAYGINDAGQVAGDSNAPYYSHAFITGPNGVGMTDLGTLGGFSA